MEMPEIRRCFGLFPPKHASYLISLFGLGSGGVGLAGIILYGLVESSLFGTAVKGLDPGVKKIVLLTIGLTSLLLVISNAMLFLGVTFSSGGMVRMAKWVIFVFCFIIIVIAVGLPALCFAIEGMCFIKKVSTAVTVVVYFILFVFECIWLYFMIVVYNLEMQLG